MAPISAAVPAAVMVPMAMAMALLLSAAAATALSPAQVALPGCNTTCGNVSVPYPFGFGPSRCYWPGLNLTCDTSHHPPRLLLGDGSLRVDEIFLWQETVRVMRAGVIINTTGDLTSPGWNASLDFGRGFREHGYLLSYRNELVVSGCNVMATLSADIVGEETTKIVSGCASFCTKSGHRWRRNRREGTYKYCSGTSACCQALLTSSGVPKGVEARWLYSGNHTNEQKTRPVTVFIAEQPGWFDEEQRADGFEEAPLLLDFAVTQGLPQPNSSDCPQDVRRMVCKSEHSHCRAHVQGYTCRYDGYNGNAYLAGGCQDIDECMIPEHNSCLGGCNNLPGGYTCRRVFRFSTGLIIGLSIASVMALLLVPSILFLLRKFKQRRIKVLKQKYFKQNRGQLLQQLVSQKADIAERMIIPLDELVKATNNFDKARELGGGGHGTVFKGILSDLQVVAIKKSKITVQNEIDEFINEVAILSQINHKNVVKLFGCCLETEVPLLVYEFISNGTLYHHLHVEEPRSLSWGCRLRIATEIATSLAYLHSSVSIPIIHRDIKSSNILLDDTMTSKISDFGASRYISVEKTGLTTRVQGTIGYLDPMYFYTGRLTEKSDVYSFGVILVELLTRKKPFSYLSAEGDGLVSHFVNLLSKEKLIEIMDPQVMEEGGTEVQEVAMLAASCINLRGEERPTMRDVDHILHGLQGPKRYNKDGVVATELKSNRAMTDYPSLSDEQEQRFENPSSRIYSGARDDDVCKVP